MQKKFRFTAQPAYQFILLLGIVSLFSDMTYEGARSIAGGYLALLGANATTVGIVAGLGELVGYCLRLASGYFVDRTERYWPVMIFGYTTNLVAIPLLALATHWPIAAFLLILERLGRAIRMPSRDVMLSYAAQKVGMGRGFGIHEAFDRTGALLGPFLMALVFYFGYKYQTGFAALGFPALFALATLMIARWRYPKPKELATAHPTQDSHGIPKVFWLYLPGACLVAAGFADFFLIAYHFEKTNILSSAWIPITYAIAMGLNGLMSYFLGSLYDRLGFPILIIATIVVTLFAPLVFLGNASAGFIGVGLWGIGLGAQESLMRAIIGNMVPSPQRGTAYGIFNMGYGIAWFLGSATMGMLYDKSVLFLVIFIAVIQLSSLPWFFATARKLSRPKEQKHYTN